VNDRQVSIKNTKQGAILGSLFGVEKRSTGKIYDTLMLGSTACFLGELMCFLRNNTKRADPKVSPNIFIQK